MPTVRLATTLGGFIRGLYGTYQVGSDGTATVDSRDAPPLMANGVGAYLANRQGQYTTPRAPAVASATQIVANAALANGTLTVANQPDVMRQVNFVWTAGTVAISAGSVAIPYTSNDGRSLTENAALALAAGATGTYNLSYGCTHIGAPIITGLTGGAAPTRQMGTTAFIAVPIDPQSTGYATVAEAANGVMETGGWTDSAVSIGCVQPNTALGTTNTYSIFFNFVAPVI